MAFPDTTRTQNVWSNAATASTDQGLRSYMLRVYNWMASGLALTALVAYLVVDTPLQSLLVQRVQGAFGHVFYERTPLAFLFMLAPLAFVMVLSFGVNRLSAAAAQGIYWAFCVAMGGSLGLVFLQYTSLSIVSAFLLTSVAFGGLSLYGYATNRPLSGVGSFCAMGVFGLVGASLLNMFFHSTGLVLVLNVITVLVFAGLTAYDTQRIKSNYLNGSYGAGADAMAKRSVFDALAMYLNFINIFMALLSLFGDRRQ